MGLDDRKFKILKCIIQTYLETGEPVGSRTISKADGLNVSSATIRNEMTDLEEMGYIIQPHTSAGRIPTDKAYRLYVDEMMDERRAVVPNFESIMSQRMDRVENVLLNMAKLLAANTNYATMISGPRYAENELKMIQLSRLDSRHLIVVIVTEGNVIKNRVIPIDVPIDDRNVLQLNVLLNGALQGKTLDDITLGLIQRIRNEAGDYTEVVESVLQTVCDTITESKEDRPEVYTSGATNIFKYPELSGGEQASGILSAFEDKDELLELLSGAGNDIQVRIGNESELPGFHNCSVVTAKYELGKGLKGTIGIVGPKRMDYDNVISTLHSLMEQLNEVYSKFDEE